MKLNDVRSRFLSSGVLVWSAALLLGLAAFSSPLGPPQGKGPNRFIGAQKCKTCHDAAESGRQYEALTKMKHAKAFAALASDEARRLGQERGSADPQKDDRCLKCHVTAFGTPADRIAKGFDRTLGVQCESCHGPGEMHMKARLAAAAAEEEEEGFGGEGGPRKHTPVPPEEIVHDPPMSTCLGCHDKESPSFKPFCYYKAKAEIRHLNPLKPRSAEERAKLLVCGCGDACQCVDGCPEGTCGVPPKDGK